LRGATELKRFPVQLHGVSEVTELLMEPAAGVHPAGDPVLVLALPALLLHLVEDLEADVPFAKTDVGIAEGAERHELVESLVDRAGELRRLPRVLDGRTILSSPARVSAKPCEVRRQRAAQVPPPADLDRAEQLHVRFAKAAGLLVHHG